VGFQTSAVLRSYYSWWVCFQIFCVTELLGKFRLL